jgi:hypothetical protein
MADVTINDLSNLAPGTSDVFPFATAGVTPSTYKASLAQIKTALNIPAAQIQSDWTQTNTGLLDYIKNKPTVPMPLVILEDRRSTAGDALANRTWVDRAINNKAVDTAGICTLASNQFALPAGTYRLDAWVNAQGTYGTQSRIYNVTDGSILLDLSGEVSDATGYNATTKSAGYTRFVIGASKTFKVQTYVGDGRGSQRGGTNFAAYSTTQTHLSIKIEKES